MSKITTRILCYGDSLTAGFCCGGYKFAPYATFLKERLESMNQNLKIEIDSYGFSGWTTEQLLENAYNSHLKDFVGNTGPGIAVALKEKHYNLVILMAGRAQFLNRFIQEFKTVTHSYPSYVLLIAINFL